PCGCGQDIRKTLAHLRAIWARLTATIVASMTTDWHWHRVTLPPGSLVQDRFLSQPSSAGSCQGCATGSSNHRRR
ncbi:hypothetical protein, partial [Mangrovicoccus sp. HB161399]|uniref:hypothetical protein n=1 Tax=Mangrovicoccus sp. HB161399 TaxID=2720392 RepID=UPI001C12F0B8